jgi:putative Ig domain-containing protein
VIGRRFVGSLVGIAGFAALATSAWAQDYTVTTATGRLETRPQGATQLTVSSGYGISWVSVPLPFTFPYYGTSCSSVQVDAHGWLLPDGTNGIVQDANLTQPHGQDATSGAFPYSSTGDANGIIAPLWTVYSYVNYGANTGSLYVWTTGTAPARHFVMSWENVAIGYTNNPRVTIQCHLYEGTGRIVFAYSTNTSGYGTGSSYVCGIDSPIDSRFTAPAGNGILSPGYPGSDFILDPRVVTYTGTLLYDKLVSTGSGTGSTTANNSPLSGLRVELRRNSDAFAYAGATTTAANGSYSVTGIGLPAATPGTLAILAQNSACNVAPTAGGAATSWSVNTSVPFSSGSTLGTQTLGASGDANGDARAALNVACICGAAYDWASVRSQDTIPRLDVVVDSGSSAATAYVKAVAPSAASMRIASRNVANSDVWDDAVVTRTYAQHVLASIAGQPTTAYDDRFDAVTDVQNAFAQGFGWYLWAVVSGQSTALDGTSPTEGTVHDLETPEITVSKGPDVAGCVAGALYDLVDSANETGDAVDGTLTSDRVFRIADAFTVGPNVGTFLKAWIDAGYDPVAITRTFISDHVLPDDETELNDSPTESSSLGTVPQVSRGLVLNQFNEDWFSVTLPANAIALMADAAYDKVSTGATVGLEIRTESGTLVGNGSFNGATGAVHAVSTPATAGTYRVGVRHLGGGTVPTYSLQVFVPPSMDAEPVRDWTVGRPYDLPLGVADGIAPYTLAAKDSPIPPGLGLFSGTLRATGTPTTVGTYPVTIELRDSGTPVNVVSRSETVTIHDVLKIALPAYVGFPAGRAVDATLPTHEGTPPFTLSMSAGALPDGLAFAPNSLHVTGAAAAQRSVALELDGVDVAGSADHVRTRAVAAVATDVLNAPAELAAGGDACGWWFDAVQGSAVSFKAKTVKGRVKRLLAGAVLAPDRSEVTTAKVKGKMGGLSVTKLVCSESGRYYVIAASTEGEATQLLGNAVVTPPKSSKAKLADFAPAATTTVEVGALPGAALTLKFKGDKKQQLTPKVVSVTDPDGTAVAFASNVVTDGVSGTLTMTLPEGGTWTIVLGATSATGTPGKLSYSYKLVQPKDAAYSAD